MPPRHVAAAITLALLIGATGCTSATSDGKSDGGTTSPASNAPPTPADTTTPAKNDDLAPDDVERCPGFPADALKLMSLPAKTSPSGCIADSKTPRRTQRALRAEWAVYPEVNSQNDPQTAVEAAKRAFRRHQPGGDKWITENVPRLGDQAVVAVRDTSMAEARIRVRHRNAVLTVRAMHAPGVGAPSAQGVSLENIEAAALSTAVSALNAVGAKTRRPTAPAPEKGEHPRAQPVCSGLTQHADRLIPGHERTDLGPVAGSDDPRLAGCQWLKRGADNPRLDVVVQALAPSPLLGLTGSGLAEENFGLWAANGGRRSRVAGLGDEASLRHAINVKRTWKRATLNVRQDNVLIYIYYSVKGQNLPSDRAMESRATDVARDVLALQK